MTSIPRKLPFLYVVFLSLFAAVLLGWVASRLPFWGDETDIFRPVFRPWRGDQSFWWQLHQYNANPPGDSLILRWLYHFSGMQWLWKSSPELFWRLPMIFMFVLTCVVNFLGAERLTKSALIGFLCFYYTYTSGMLQMMAVETRFYTSASFFMALSIWQLLYAFETRRNRDFFFASLFVTLGVGFHMALVPMAYLLFAYGWVSVVSFLWVSRAKLSLSFLKSAFPRLFAVLFASALGFIFYKIEVKHWLFIPNPDESITILGAFRGCLSGDCFLGNFAGAQAGIFKEVAMLQVLFFMVAILFLLCSIWFLRSFSNRNNTFNSLALMRTLQNGAVGAALIGIPLAFYYSSKVRAYELIPRHFSYSPSLVCASLVLVFLTVRDFIQSRNIHRRFSISKVSVLLPLLSILICSYFFRNALINFADFADFAKDSLPTKITYPLVEWRALYRQIPAPRQLVIVGSQPDSMTALSDQGEFRAGAMLFYTKEFSPIFYSLKGTYNSQEIAQPSLAGVVEREPRKFDFLVMDDLAKAKQLFPRIAWNTLECHSYSIGRKLSFCRN